MRAVAVQIADGVPLELQPVNHEGRRSLGFRRCGRSRLLFVLGGFKFLRLGIAKNQNEPRAVWGPLEIVNALRNVGQANRLSATAIKQPYLRFPSVTRRQEIGRASCRERV